MINKKFKFNKYIGILIAIPILILVWYILSIVLDSKILPSPFMVFADIPEVLSKPETFNHVLYSLRRITIGMFISVFLGTIIGASMAYNKIVDSILSPIVYLTYPIPKLALLPIVILTFGLGETSKIIMIVSILIFQIITSIRSAIQNIPKSNFNYFKIMGASKLKTFCYIVIPIIIKQLFVTLKIATGTAISVLFFTETFGTKNGGLGYYIMDMFQSANYIHMYTGIVLLSLIGFSIFILLDVLEKLLTPWSV